MSLMKNHLTQLWKTEEENRTKKSIDKKSPKLDKEMWEENRRYMW